MAATDGLGAVAGLSLARWRSSAVSIVVASAIGDTVFFESTRALGLARAMTVSMTYPADVRPPRGRSRRGAADAPVLLGSVITLAGIALIVTARPAEPILPAASGRAWARRPSPRWPGRWRSSCSRPRWTEIDAVTAQAVRLPIAGAALLLTPWGWAAPAELRRGGRALAWRLLLVSAVTLASSVLFVAGLKYGGVAAAHGAVLHRARCSRSRSASSSWASGCRGASIAGSVITVAGIAVLRS